jgi:hypothetical protein
MAHMITTTLTLFGDLALGVKESDHCRTPEWLYKALDCEFAFDLDPCPLSLTPTLDGLKLDWNGKRVFCNPPYSNIGPWVDKAVSSAALTVFLVPARFDSAWCRRLREAKADFRFFKAFNFEAHDGTERHPVGGAMVVILNRLYPLDTVAA